MPAACNWSTIKLKIVLPAIGIKAFGWVYVCGRSFAPAPATGIIAFIRSSFVETSTRHVQLTHSTRA
jgi:hypothetical protein